jgi:hypothetical protein
MKTLPALLILCVAPGGGPACGGPSPGHERIVLTALLEGFYEDGFDTGLARTILAAPAPGYFVPKCPLCEPVRYAFQVYAAAPPPPTNGYRGDAVPAPILEGLRSAERGARLEAMKRLVDRYVGRKLDRSALTEAQRAEFGTWAQSGRKYGMSVKSAAFGDYCPSCEGVNRKK